MSPNSQADLPHTDSIDSQDPNNVEKKKAHKSRRPPNTAFRQQRLMAWQPVLTPKQVLPMFFLVGLIMSLLGGLLLWSNSQVQQISIDYSTCVQDAPSPPEWSTLPSSKVSKTFKGGDYPGKKAPQWQKETGLTVTYNGENNQNISVSDTSICRLQFDIEKEMKPPVLLYYRVTNMYQNHRRYVKSFDQSQLNGDARTVSEIKSGDCDPLNVETQPDGTSKPYYPCGLIANSIFNDTINSPILLNPDDGKNTSEYLMTEAGIAWASDKDLYKPTKYNTDDIVPPPNWRRKYPEYNSTLLPPNLHNDEPFQVWMRTAGLPTFSKLALRNNNDPMKQGRYSVDIWDEFPVASFTGTKSILISTATVMGGKNPFLGIAYIVVGAVCLIAGAIFTVAHIVKPRQLGDHKYLTWSNELQSTTPGATTATAAGNSSVRRR